MGSFPLDTLPEMGVPLTRFDELPDECKKVWPSGKGKAVCEGERDVYTQKLKAWLSSQGGEHFPVGFGRIA